MKNPKVSIVCISYNHEKFITQAIDSFLAQKANFEYEIIIADDASQDNTKDIISVYAEKHSNVVPILRQKNTGVQPNLVGAMAIAKGEYIALCEGDDFWTDDKKLQKQVDFMSDNTEYSLCFHPVRVFYENQEKEDSIHPKSSKNSVFNLEELIKNNYIQTNSVMYRKKTYDKIPLNILPLDWYLHLYHAKSGKVGFINEVMSTYRRHSGGVWWDSNNDISNIWTKHGRAHYAMYCEIRKLFNDTPSLQEIIQPNIYRTLGILIDTDRKYLTHLVDQAMEDYPDSVDPLTALLSKNILEYERILDDKIHKMDDLTATNIMLSDELRKFKNLKAWKAFKKVQGLKNKLLGK